MLVKYFLQENLCISKLTVYSFQKQCALRRYKIHFAELGLVHHRFSRIAGPLVSLDWLPVKSLVQFKIGLITYKVYKNKYPAYLKNYVQPYRSIYHTRLSGPARHMLSIFHIITINRTNPLHIYLVVFSI